MNVATAFKSRIAGDVRVRLTGLVLACVVPAAAWAQDPLPATTGQVPPPLADAGGLEILASGPVTNDLTYYALPGVFCLIACLVGAYLHGRKVDSAAQRFPESTSSVSLWAGSAIVWLLCTLTPVAVFVYWSTLADVATQAEFARRGFLPWITAAIGLLVPLMLGIVSVFAPSKGGAQ